MTYIWSSKITMLRLGEFFVYDCRLINSSCVRCASYSYRFQLQKILLLFPFRRLSTFCIYYRKGWNKIDFQNWYMYIDLSISNIKIKVLFADCIYFHTLKLTLISEGEYNKSNSFYQMCTRWIYRSVKLDNRIKICLIVNETSKR